MKRIHKLFLLSALIFVTISNLMAQDAKGVGEHGAVFLRIHPTARQVAMGDAFSALVDDINLMRYNIGGLGNMRNIQLSANFHNWVDDTQQGAVSLALPTRFGVFGFDFSYFDEGDIIELDEEFNPTGGTASSDDIMLTLGYGNYIKIFSHNFGFGGGVKVLRQNLVGNQTTALAFDLGGHLRLKHVSIGATVQNLGLSQIKLGEKEDSLPEIYRAGLGTRLPIGKNTKLNLAADAAWIRKQSMRYYSGGELIIGDLLALRGGYRFNELEPSPWSAGFGLFIPMEWLANSSTRLDYAYSPMDAFERTLHRFSLVFTFGVAQRVFALNYQDRERLDAMSEKLRSELEAAEKARLAAQQAEERTRLLEEEISERLARIKQIAAESQGKIEVEPQEENRILVTMRINFDFDKAVIRPEEYATMSRVGEILNTYPEARAHISGHTDSIGTDQYNIHLSQRRINSVMSFLTSKENVSADRFFMPVGYGELRPVADNGTSDGRFRNRRVEFLLYTMDSVPEIPEGTAVESIQVAGDDNIQIVCNGKVTYKLSRLTDPERILVDLPNIFLLTEKNTWSIGRGPFIRARVGFHPDKQFTRVVFDMERPTDVTVRSVGNILEVSPK